MKAILKNNFSFLKFSQMNFCLSSMKIENKNYHQNENFYFLHKLLISSDSNFNCNSIKNSNNIQAEIKNIKIKKEKEINNSMIIDIVKPIENILLNDYLDNDINNSNKNKDSIIKINEIQFKARNNRIPKQVRLF